MRDNGLLTGRKAGDCLLFGITFVGLLLAGGGVIVSSAPLAFAGAAVALLAVLCFALRAPSEG
jgi:hypothetical protein